MIPLAGDRTAIMQTLLPDDPEPGQEYTLPEGQNLGGANVINIHKNGKLLGSVTRIAPVPNVSGKYDSSRVTSKIQLRKGDILQVKGWQYVFNSVKFVEYFGWVGTGTIGDPIPLMDKTVRVLDLFSIGEKTPGFYLYERVCLEVIKGEEDAKPTNPTTTATGNPKTAGSGPADA